MTIYPIKRFAAYLGVALALATCGPEIETRVLSKEESEQFVESTIESAILTGPASAGVIVKARLQCKQKSKADASGWISL